LGNNKAVREAAEAELDFDPLVGSAERQRAAKVKARPAVTVHRCPSPRSHGGGRAWLGSRGRGQPGFPARRLPRALGRTGAEAVTDAAATTPACHPEGGPFRGCRHR